MIVIRKIQLRFFSLLIGILLVLGSVGCQTVDIDEIINPDRSLFYGETLTIAYHHAFRLEELIEKYMRVNEGVTIEVIDYWDYYMVAFDWTMARKDVATQLMAGSAPVLISSILVDSLNPRTHSFFFDWFQIMYADPDFNEDDWFMNVFHASSSNGKLYDFPLSFAFHSIGVNSTVPGLLDEWEWRNNITVLELIDLHQNFQTETPYFLAPGFDPTWAAFFLINDNADIETGEIGFGDEFIDIITYMRSAVNPVGSRRMFEVVPTEIDIERSELYLFEFYASWQFLYFLDDSDFSLFTNQKPIVNNQRELIVFLDNNLLLNTNASATEKALAWDFIKFISNPEHQDWESRFRHPTNRALLRHDVETRILFFIDFFEINLPISENEAIEHVINKITKHGEMPMRRYSDLPGILGDWEGGLIMETMLQFKEGVISAEDLARNLQNMVELMLMEIGVR